MQSPCSSNSRALPVIKAAKFAFIGLVLLMGISGAAQAAVYKDNVCSSPQASDGHANCVGSANNAGAIINSDVSNSRILGMRAVPGGVTVPIDVWGTCRYINNPSTDGTSYFIPFKSAPEWSSVVATSAGFQRLKCSRPYDATGTYAVAAPPYGPCTASNANVGTPQIYARYPGGTNQTSGASFVCNSGTTTVSAAELWNGLDSDGNINYHKSWAPTQTVYGPNILLKANNQLGNLSVDISTPVTLTWTASGGNGENNISCTPAAWNGTPNTSGSVTLSLTAAAVVNYSLTCTDNTYGLSSTAIVTVNGLPNVTASLTGSPSTIVVGGSSTLTWTSSNATSCSIDNGIGVVRTSGSTVVYPAVTTAYTLTCTNAGGGASQSTIITVYQPVSVSFTGSPTTILSGSSSTLTWSSTNATSCSIDNGIGAVATSGRMSVSPSGTTIYTLTCANPGSAASQSTTITVDQPVSVSFTASPSTIVAGASSKLTWGSTNATNCSIDNAIGSVAVSGSMNVTPGATTTYTLSCSNAAGGATQTTTVTVDQPVTASLSVTPSTVIAATTATLNWTSTNATGCTLDNSIGVVSLTGSTPVSPVSTTTYTLTCANAASSTTQVATLTVVQPVAATFTANPTAIALGGTSTLTWTPANAVACSIDNSIGSVAPRGGSTPVSPTRTTTYTLNCNDGLSGPGSSITATATVTVCGSGYTVVGNACVAAAVDVCLRTTALVQVDEGFDLQVMPTILTRVSGIGKSSVVAAFKFNGSWINFFGTWFDTELYGVNAHGGAYWNPYPSVVTQGGNNSADGFALGLLYNGNLGSPHGPTLSWDLTPKIAAQQFGRVFDTGLDSLDNLGDHLTTRYTGTLVPCATPASIPAASCTSGTSFWGTPYFWSTGTCQGNMPAAADGTQITVTDAFTGKFSAVMQCVDGQWGHVSGACGETCPAASLVDCNGATVNLPLAVFGSSQTVNGNVYTCALPSCTADMGCTDQPPPAWGITGAYNCPVSDR